MRSDVYGLPGLCGNNPARSARGTGDAALRAGVVRQSRQPARSGRLARAGIDDARDRIADHLNAQASEIVFTSGGTEADNLAIKGAARALSARGKHLVVTAIEHQAVLASCRALEAEGFRVTYLSPNHDGLITPDQVAAAITPETVLVSCMYANNEMGAIQPIADIGLLCRGRHVVFHTDAIQAAGSCRWTCGRCTSICSPCPRISFTDRRA